MLGLDYQFSISTAAYQSLKRSDAWRWPAQDRVGRLPARQYVGPGGGTVEFEGSIYPAYRGGLRQIDRMRAVADGGEPLRLVDGTGKNWGLWCVERIEETGRVFFSDGRPRRIDFYMRLSEYGEDG